MTSTNGHGGKREGAGRKTKFSTLNNNPQARRLLDEGISPLEVMLIIMRQMWATVCYLEEEENVNLKVLIDARMNAFNCAKDAAPYCHPRLAQIQNQTSEDEKKIPLAVTQEDMAL